MNKLYTIRSKLAHGNKLTNSELNQNLSLLREYARKVIIKYLEKHYQKNNIHSDIIDQLDYG